MKNDSPLFDRIKVRPDKDRTVRPSAPACEWPACVSPGTHRAPKGRLREKEYWRFCLEHVREYNHSYNFFAGMSTDDIAKYQREAVVGHRPTWKMGSMGGGKTRGPRPDPGRFYAGGPEDPFGLFGDPAGGAHGRGRTESRMIGNAQRKALNALGLESDADTSEIKARFKALVKRHHPDANGGDRSSEDKLREIIQAYNYLKSIGFR
jgi:DnaJ domain